MKSFCWALKLDAFMVLAEDDGDGVVPDAAEDLVDLPDLLLVLEEDGRVEVGDLLESCT